MSHEKPETPFECVDPIMGDEIWQLDSPAIDADLRRKLEAHVLICHACRLDRDLDTRARQLLRTGELVLDETPRPVLSRFPLARAAGLAAVMAIAASLAGILLLSPRPVGADYVVRGDDETRFTSPVEGEVVSVTGCRLGWTEVPGATRYQVRVTARDGDFAWTGTTTDLHVELPVDIALIDGAGYKALLSTQPADLLPPGRTSVAFAAGSLLDVAVHRLRWADPRLHGLGLAGLALFCLAVASRRG